jgi:hypothetical protein
MAPHLDRPKPDPALRAGLFFGLLSGKWPGDIAGVETWHRILNAIERLQTERPAEGENVH